MRNSKRGCIKKAIIFLSGIFFLICGWASLADAADKLSVYVPWVTHNFLAKKLEMECVLKSSACTVLEKKRIGLKRKAGADVNVVELVSFHGPNVAKAAGVQCQMIVDGKPDAKAITKLTLPSKSMNCGHVGAKKGHAKGKIRKKSKASTKKTRKIRLCRKGYGDCTGSNEMCVHGKCWDPQGNDPYPVYRTPKKREKCDHDNECNALELCWNGECWDGLTSTSCKTNKDCPPAYVCNQYVAEVGTPPARQCVFTDFVKERLARKGSSLNSKGKHLLPEGFMCSKNSECGSGYCANGQVCAPKDGTGMPGAYCHHDNHCASGKCTCGAGHTLFGFCNDYLTYPGVCQ